ncbi:MAG: FKBP-type peptidyl-prolyl cis-trans isomerase, partial [Chloroflexi bacterium]|nr:FKBP-type peptidyl-prolyl cis-trans isomerase [Chloroflexota bacterium]
MVRATLVAILAITVVLVACADDGSEEPLDTSGPPPIEVEGVTTASGLQIFDVIIGEGEEVRAGDAAAIHYAGWLESGVQFDTSLGDGEPFAFGLGGGQVIAGWDEGIVGMKPGGIRRLIVPPELGYGAQGSDNVPPNAVLTYDI